MEERKLLKEIVRMRKERGMTQQELADIAGVTNVYISNLEKGKKRMSQK